MNELIKEDNIENMIYEIRGIEVMLDSDLARIYKCKNGTKEVNQAVKNNIDKFPERFSWKLTDEEISILRSKILTTNISTMSRSNPRVFTEQGVYMLSTILKTNIATEVTLKIMDTFVKMRHMLINNQNVLPNRLLILENKVDSNTKRIDELFNKFSNNDINNQYTFYKGAFYDTYSLFLDILFKGVNEIIIIDNYAGHELLNMIKDVNKKIIIISKNINNKLKEKYEEQYHNVTFIYNNSIHDRYIILDRKRLFHSGMSFKDMGKITFSITEFDNKEEITIFVNNLKDKIKDTQ
jgi:hypothetical protein